MEEKTCKLTDPEVIEHLKENYYIRREDWPKTQGYYWDTKNIWLSFGFMEARRGFDMKDLESRWILCPKE